MKNKFFLIVFLSLFIFYSILLIAESQGYYKNKHEKAKILTEEQIKDFEKDVEAGKDIDVKKYVLYKDIDYSNKVSKNVYGTSLKLESIFDGTVKLIFNGASKAVSD